MMPTTRDHRPVRVLQVLHGLARAGAEQLVYELATANRPALRTEVICLDTEGPLADLMRREGFGIHFTRRREGLDTRQIARIARVIRAYRPHVLHAHQYTPFFYAALAHLAAPHGRVLFTEHGRHFPDVVGWKRRALNRLLCRRAHHVTAVCRFTAERLAGLEGIPRSRIEIVYNGVDVDRFDPDAEPGAPRRMLDLPADAVVVMQVGTFRSVKDQATAVRAVAHLAAEEPNVVLVFVGDGPDRPACEALADELGLAGRVRFAGLRGDVPALLPAADIMLMTSLSEAHSVSLLEGMATALPVVATDVGGIPETVEAGVTGLLAPARDDRTLAEALRTLVRDPERRRAMGRAGRRRVCERFRRDAMHRRYVQIYQALAGGIMP